MEKFKNVLKIVYRVYSIICVCITTILIIAAIIICANFGKITGKALELVVDNFNQEINTVISSFFAESITNDSIRFNSIRTIKGGGLQAEFSVNNNVVSSEEIASYAEKTNEELFEEFGITADTIPPDILTILGMVKQSLVLDFVDNNRKNVLSREITSAEIKKLLGNS
ncbi:MAG: hypothetical protein LBU88_05895 [Treponema sp.]|jgi:hypothetical protein|nr:hypothetical protein [Treponema sp.]